MDIIADILKVASNGANKTKIMYIANLSYELLQKYLEETIDIGFMCFNGSGYEVTDRGRLFLEKYIQFSSRYSALKSELELVTFEKEILKKMCEHRRDGSSKSILRRRKK